MTFVASVVKSPGRATRSEIVPEPEHDVGLVVVEELAHVGKAVEHLQEDARQALQLSISA